MLRLRASTRTPEVAGAVQRRWKHFVPTPTGLSTTMTIVNPFVHREPQLADALQALPAVPTLLHAIKRYDSRPFRIISHECEDGKLFNCAFFDSKADMSAYKAWYTACALTEGGKFHGPLSTAFADQSDMPTPETWLWGSGMEVTKRQRGRPPLRFAEVAATVAQVLSDSRFGEYQLGMAVRYSRMVFRDEAVKDEAERAALTTEFGAPMHPPTRVCLKCMPPATPCLSRSLLTQLPHPQSNGSQRA